MTQRRNEQTPDHVLEQLRQLMTQYETPRSVPPPFEPLDNSVEPWSVPPPGGFQQLRESLRRAS